MMKIEVLTKYLSGHGGTETVISSVLNSISFATELFVAKPMPNVDWLEKINDSRITVGKYSDKRFLLFLIYHLIQNSSDEILILDTDTLKVAKFVKTLFKKKYKIVSWIHFSINDEKIVDEKELRKADAHLAISSGIKKQLMQLGIPEKQIFLVYNPIEKNTSLVNRNDSEQIRLKYVGRIQLEGQKNIKFLLEVVRQNPSIYINVFGSGEDLNEAKQIADNYGISQRIHWMGWSNDVWNDDEKYDALFLCSNFEGFPMVLLESISRGLPVISADCPTGPDDIIEAGKNGFLFKKNSLKDVQKCINSLVSLRTVPSLKVQNSIEKFYGDIYINNLERALSTIQNHG